MECKGLLPERESFAKVDGMRAFLPIAAALCAMVISGCTSTGVVPCGYQTYMISGSQPGIIGTGEVQARLLKEANAWCQKQGLAMVPMDITGHDSLIGSSNANACIRFKAVPPSDYAKTMTSVGAVPSQIIETKAR